MNTSHERKWDEEDVEKILKAVSSEVPKLIENILKPLRELLDEFYSPEKVKQRADVFVVFYKTLTENNVPEEEAIKLAKTQLLDINMILEKIFESFSKSRHYEWK